MIKLYESKNKMNEGGRNIYGREADIGYKYYEIKEYINNYPQEQFGLVKKYSSKVRPFYENPSGYNKDELFSKLDKFVINTPFDLSKMTLSETYDTFLIKTFGTDVLVELVVDIQFGIISQEQFDLVFNNLMNTYHELKENNQIEVVKIIDTELKNKKRFKRTIWTDDYAGEIDYYIKFSEGLSEVIDKLINSNFLSIEYISELEDIKTSILGLSIETKDKPKVRERELESELK